MTKFTWDQVGLPVSPAPFFASPGVPAAPALRQGGRAFFGAASGHNQATDGSVAGGSWLQGFAVPSSAELVEDWDYYEDVARVVSVSTFGIAFSGVSRTAGGSLDAIGIVGAVVNDNGSSRDAWGIYADALSAHAGAGITHGIEVNATNLVGTSPLGGATPYRAYTDRMTGLANFAAGSDATVFGRSYAVDWLMNVANNGAAFWTGINFRFDAIMREGVADDTSSPGNDGYARAISLAHEQGLSWFSRNATLFTAGAFVVGRTYVIQSVGSTDFTSIGASSNTVGVSFTATGAGSGTGTASETATQAEVVRIHSTVDSAAIRWEMVFTDTAWALNDRVAPNGAQFQVGYVADAGAHLFVQPAVAGQAPWIEPRGTNENINWLAKGKGTGLFGFGTFTAGSDAAITGYVQIVTEDGTVRKLAVIA